MSDCKIMALQATIWL